MTDNEWHKAVYRRRKKKMCTLCSIRKENVYFSFSIANNKYNSRCKKCVNLLQKTKNKLLGRSREDFIDKFRKKYNPVIEHKKLNPRLCLKDICAQYSVNYCGFMCYYRRRKLKPSGSRNIRIYNIDRPPKHKQPKWMEYHRKYSRTQRETIQDSYILNVFFRANGKRIPKEYIPQSLLNAKRAHLTLKRYILLNKKLNEQH